MIEFKNSKKNKNEKDFKLMVKNPINMRNQWRQRLRISANLLSKEKDPEKRKKYQIMYAKQKQALKEWEEKAKKKK